MYKIIRNGGEICAIFDILDLYFSDYKKIFDNSTNGLAEYSSQCQEIKNRNTRINHLNIIKEYNTCIKLMAYLFDIHSVRDNTLRIKNGLQYLYYLLYRDDQNSLKYSKQINEIYKEFINLYYKTSTGDLIKPYSEINIFDNEWKKLRDIYDLNTKINYIKNYNTCSETDRCDCVDDCAETYMRHEDACLLNSGSHFCDALENIRNQYNNIPNITEECDNLKCKMLPCIKYEDITLPYSRTSTKQAILIPVTIILIISLLIFILNKFIPWCSHFNRLRKRYYRKHTDKICSIQKSSDVFEIAAWNNRCNILYNST
ncbi:variable surface protein [Plasmodium gonderi]|uniref:Variable surface protein n=1 Tax=Plasmodium gonderi TaxID=77519 RepID=A0A1Y1JQF5_PLAGO|nr:variable surface protein [Plasmodium gonderi]GAW84430.1 variable surface protein [Plasmodium gonderi]